MQPRRLRYFLVLAEELHFTRAAQRLHMAQPALTNQIKRMEEELGVALFERIGRRVELTVTGELLVGEAQRILGQLERTQSLIQQAGRGEIGQLRLGFTPSAATGVLSPILTRFREDYPGVEIFLHEMKADELVDRLENNWLDVSFLYLPFDDERFQCMSVGREPLVIALPHTHSLAAATRIEIRDLAREPFILPARHRRMPGLYGRVMELCRQAGFVPDAIQKDVWLMQTIVSLVGSGLGIALVPESLRKIYSEGVDYREIADLEPTVEMGMIWSEGNRTPALGSFLETVRGLSEFRDSPVVPNQTTD